MGTLASQLIRIDNCSGLLPGSLESFPVYNRDMIALSDNSFVSTAPKAVIEMYLVRII